MRSFGISTLLTVLVTIATCPAVGTAQEDRPRPTAKGSAIIHILEREYALPMLCYEGGRPERGFVTDPGPPENRNRNLIRVTGLPGDEEGGFRLVVRDGAHYYEGTLSEWTSAAGVMEAETTVHQYRGEGQLEMALRVTCGVGVARLGR